MRVRRVGLTLIATDQKKITVDRESVDERMKAKSLFFHTCFIFLLNFTSSEALPLLTIELSDS